MTILKSYVESTEKELSGYVYVYCVWFVASFLIVTPDEGYVESSPFFLYTLIVILLLPFSL